MNSQSARYSKRDAVLIRRNLRLARIRWGPNLNSAVEHTLRDSSANLKMSVEGGDLLLIEGKWYVTHSGLLRLATRRHCRGIVRGAEMRVAETRAVNRALRKAYGIGVCSVEEIGSLPARSQPEANVRKLPPQPVNGNGEPKLRDQLCLLIRQHGLNASLVKQYAAEFCGTRDIREASREQIQSFITRLAEQATKDRDGLLCKLNSYTRKPQEGAA